MPRWVGTASKRKTLKGSRSVAPSPPVAPRRRAARRGGCQRACRGTPADPSLNHLIRPPQQRRRDRQAERLGRLEVDDQLELGGLLDGQVAWLCALEDLVHVDGAAPIVISK